MTTIILSFLLTAVPFTVIDNNQVVDELVKEDFELRYADRLLIDQPKLELQMDILNEKLYEDPINAKLDDDGHIIKEKPGEALDRRTFQQLFQEYFYEEGENRIETPVRAVYPRVDSELLADIREEEIGHYTTDFKPENRKRSRNIELAAEAINNQVVFPGERFSFNNVVGKRTKEKGYKQAPVIIKGELSEGIGGGICQVSSTLYNAVDLKGIEIKERYSHSRSVPYVPSGRDATISWNGPDFSFINRRKKPVLLQASAADGHMNVVVLSSKS
ncbi:VanW family protein [Barrientosiimonas marina]|uniref:VanW family protein n=1 Tax=Lentibacillus kimchii TaxID=1542911 RepID=A0ABW2UQW3_9BACI